MDKAKQEDSAFPVKAFLAFSLLLVTIVTLAAGLVSFIYAKGKDEARLVHETATLDLAKNLTSRNLKAVVADLNLVRASLPLHRYIEQGDLWGLADLAKEMRNFALSRPVYDQVRFIDEAGYEVVRVDRDEGVVGIAPASQLQDKSKRPYFSETITLSTGDVHVSPLDLNIEHGKIEIPYIPVLRLATPLYDSVGRSRGMVVLNLKGEPLLKDMAEVLASTTGQTMMVDGDGYWLLASNPDDAWGSQLDHGRSFVLSHPEAWREMSTIESGIIETPDGRYVFTSIYLQAEIHKHLNDFGFSWSEAHDREQNSRRWFFISRIPTGMLSALSDTVLWQTLAVYILVLGTIIGATALVMRARAMRLLVEDELVQKSALLQMTLESIDQGFSVWNGEGKLKAWNSKCVDMWHNPDDVYEGMSRLDVLRHAAAIGELGDGDPDLLAANRYANIVEAGRDSSEELNLLDGRIVNLHRFPMPDGGHASVYTDITQQRHYEGQLAEARDVAEGATRSKSAFLAAMSHEIRTPMNGVVGMIDLLQQTDMSGDQRTMMNTARDSAFSLLQIINDILDFSKIEAGKMSLEAIPVSVCEVMDSVCETLVPNSAAKNLRLNLFVDPDIPAHVISDPVRLRQILFNLAGNSVKFTVSSVGQVGDVTLRADRLADDVDGRILVRFTVKDSGIGMAPEAVAKLFMPFTQADQSTTRRFGGTGLGLSICKNLTDIMGGKIEVQSEEGVGSDFIVTLPFAEARTEALEDVNLSGLCVAHVLTEPFVVDSTTRYLSARGADVLAIQGLSDVLNVLPLNDPVDVLIIGCEWEQEAIDALIASLEDGAQKLKMPSLVLLSRDRTDRTGLLSPGKVKVLADPMHRLDFYQGVALAAGIIKPEDLKKVARFIAPKRKAPSVEAARATGELVLLAEDNLTNQDVITRQLNVLGYACEVAGNGLIALGKLDQGGYALLLTDLHMPEMDGYELTASIRDLELDKTDHLPVVAITANALQGEDDRCIAAGMDGYLSKPVEMQKLKEALDRWAPLAQAEAQPNQKLGETHMEGKAKTQAGDEAVLETTYLKETFGDDPELIRDILKDYVEPSAAIVGEMDDAFTNKDAATVGSAAHKLKSSSRAVGANALADLCFELEKAGKGGQWELVDGLYPQLRPAFELVRSYIENL